MKLHDFRIGWRLLLQERGYSAVSILGLALGFAVCFPLLGFVRYCLNYNGQVPQASQVYVLKQRINVFPRPAWEAYTYLPLRGAAVDSGMVEESAIVKGLNLPLFVDRQRHEVALALAAPSFGRLFGVPTLQGDLEAALSRPDGMALSAGAARKLFGAAPALGQRVRVDKATLQVLAVLADPPANTTVSYEALIGLGNSAWTAPHHDEYAASFQVRGGVYLRLKPGADPAALTARLQQATNEAPSQIAFNKGPMGKGLNGRNVTDIGLVALPDVYFDPELANGRRAQDYGQRSNVYGLAGIAVLILLLAASNYVNLATVRTLRRQREIGMRKLLGASHARLVAQFLAESTLVALLATALGLILAWLCLPAFSELVARRLDQLFTPASCAAALLLGVLVGLCAGAYPAWIALHVRPAAALAGRGDSETASGLWLRRALTVLQFATAMALSGATLAVAWQADYASHVDRGFNPANLLMLDMPSDTSTPAGHDFKAALARLPGIDGVAATSEAVGRDRWKTVGTVPGRDGEPVRMELRMVSPEFFQVYGLAPVHGRLFDPARDQLESGEAAPRVGVVNAAAALALGFATPEQAVGQIIREGQIVGVAPEVRYQSLRQHGQPLMYRIGPAQVLAVRTTLDMDSAYRAIAPLWARYFPDDVLKLDTAASLFGQAYQDDQRLARMLGASSLITVALAACGIYVLSAYSVQRSRKEIVLRKLHGAGRGAIARLVGREFAALIAAGALLGLPLATLAIQRYLAGYVEQAPMGAWPLLAALTLAGLVALAATARHTLAALRISPALALR